MIRRIIYLRSDIAVADSARHDAKLDARRGVKLDARHASLQLAATFRTRCGNGFDADFFAVDNFTV